MFYRLSATVLFLFLTGLTPLMASEPSFEKGRESAFKTPYFGNVPSLAFHTAEGSPETLQSLQRNALRGKGIVLHIWASNCAPCLKELALLNAAAPQLEKEGYALLALSEDAVLQKAQETFRNTKIHHLRLLWEPEGNAFRLLNLKGLPTTIFLNKEGKEMGRLSGTVDWQNMATLDEIAHLLHASPSEN